MKKQSASKKWGTAIVTLAAIALLAACGNNTSNSSKTSDGSKTATSQKASTEKPKTYKIADYATDGATHYLIGTYNDGNDVSSKSSYVAQVSVVKAKTVTTYEAAPKTITVSNLLKLSNSALESKLKTLDKGAFDSAKSAIAGADISTNTGYPDTNADATVGMLGLPTNITQINLDNVIPATYKDKFIAAVKSAAYKAPETYNLKKGNPYTAGSKTEGYHFTPAEKMGVLTPIADAMNNVYKQAISAGDVTKETQSDAPLAVDFRNQGEAKMTGFSGDTIGDAPSKKLSNNAYAVNHNEGGASFQDFVAYQPTKYTIAATPK